MKKLLTIILAFLPVLAFSQIKYDSVRVVKPQNFVEALTIDTAIVQIISQKSGVNRRINFQTAADWILAQQPNLDSAQYTSDTLLLFYGPDTILAVITSGTIDTVYLSGDTMGIVFAGDTTEVVLAGLGDGNGLFDATNDGDTTAIGSVVLGEDLTVELNNHDWLFDGLVEDDTTSRIMTLRGDGSLAYRWLDSLLNGYTTGSGTPGTLPIWTGAGTLGNSSVTESGGNVIGTSFTGAFKLATGTTDQTPVGANGLMRYNSTENGISAWNGAAAAWQYLPWADADNWASGYVPYMNSAGTALTAGVNLIVNSAGELLVGGVPDNGAYELQVDSGLHLERGTMNLDANARISANASSGSVGGAVYTFANSNTAGGYCARFSSDGEALVARSISNTPSYAAIETQLDLGANGAVKTQNIKRAINISSKRSSTSTNQNNSRIPLNGGMSLNWEYSISDGQPYYEYYSSVASISVPVIDTVGSSSTQMVFQNLNSGVADTVLILAEALTAPMYGSGAVTGTHAYSASFTSSGKLIEVPEKWGAISTSTDGSGDIVIAHGMGTTPTSVQVTVTGTADYSATVHTIGSTNFTVRFRDRMPAFGEMYIDDADPDTITFSSGGTTPAESTDWTAGDLLDFTYSGGRLTYTGADTARFIINTDMSFSFTLVNSVIQTWIYKNGAEVPGSEIDRRIGVAGDVGNSGQVSIVSLAPNDYIEIFYAPESHTGDNDIIIKAANVSIQKITGEVLKGKAITATWHAKT